MTAPAHVILGATGGIGSALARRLAADGARLLLAGRDPDRLAELGEALEAPTCLFDALDAASVEAVVRDAVQRFGRVDGLANCVGSLLLKPAHRTSPDEWSAVLDTNLGSAFHAVRAATAVMQKTGGSIVLVASAAAGVGLANHEAIGAAKAGVNGLALAAAATYAPRGIRVNTVAPGLVRTPLAAGITGNELALEASSAMHPLGRIGEPEEVAEAIAFLLDARQSWITGQTLGVDGGLASIRGRKS